MTHYGTTHNVRNLKPLLQLICKFKGLVMKTILEEAPEAA
jgi:hypothetical protein